MVPIAYMPSPIPRQVGWNLFARTLPFASAFPRNRGGSAPASLFSGPAQRSLTLRPTRSPSRLSDPLHQRLQQSRCLHRCSDCYRVERTSSRAGLTPAVDHHLFTAHPVLRRIRSGAYLKSADRIGTNPVGGGDELLLRAIACPLEGFDAIGFAAGRVEDFAVAYALESGAYQADPQHAAGRI